MKLTCTLIRKVEPYSHDTYNLDMENEASASLNRLPAVGCRLFQWLEWGVSLGSLNVVLNKLVAGGSTRQKGQTRITAIFTFFFCYTTTQNTFIFLKKKNIY